MEYKAGAIISNFGTCSSLTVNVVLCPLYLFFIRREIILCKFVYKFSRDSYNGPFS